MWIRRAPWQMSRASPYTKSIKKQHSEAECWCHRTVNIHTCCTTKIQNVKQFLSLGSPTSRLQKFLSCFQVGACFKRHKYLKIILNVESRTPTSLYFNNGCSYNSISEDDFDLNESLQAVHETTPCKTNLPWASLYQKTSESFLPGLTQVALGVERHDQRPVFWRWRLYSNLAWHCYTRI